MLEATAFPAIGMRPVEEGWVTGCGVVILVAWCTYEQAGVEGRVGVTGSARGRSTLENINDLAIGIWHIGMCIGQLEAGMVVIKGCLQPAAGVMTGTAICAELVFVRIILLVKGVAILGRPLEVGNAP